LDLFLFFLAAGRLKAHRAQRQAQMASPRDAQEAAHLDRMALISQVLLQPRLLALRKENEELKLKLFWKEHCRSKLQELMEACNQAGPKCNCLSCAVAGRKDEEQDALPWGAECKFKLWFEDKLVEHGLTTLTGVMETQKQMGPHESCDDGNSVYDVDAHFHHIARDDWFAWMYGAKLWKAARVSDPELQKLSSLFVSLTKEAEGFDE
jgi:hypothetical protein